MMELMCMRLVRSGGTHADAQVRANPSPSFLLQRPPDIRFWDRGTLMLDIVRLVPSARSGSMVCHEALHTGTVPLQRQQASGRLESTLRAAFIGRAYEHSREFSSKHYTMHEHKYLLLHPAFLGPSKHWLAVLPSV
jgi:hypothetical protein